MSKEARSHTVVDAESNCLRCTMCGEEAPVPLGSTIWVIGVLGAFVQAHLDCRLNEPQQKRTYLAEIVPPALRGVKSGGPTP